MARGGSDISSIPHSMCGRSSSGRAVAVAEFAAACTIAVAADNTDRAAGISCPECDWRSASPSLNSAVSELALSSYRSPPCCSVVAVAVSS